MPWLQIHFAVNDADARRLEPLLEDSGACAVTLTDAADQPLLEPLPGETPIWDETVASAMYTADADLQAILIQLAADWQAPLPPLRVEQLADQDWERAWIDDLNIRTEYIRLQVERAQSYAVLANVGGLES